MTGGNPAPDGGPGNVQAPVAEPVRGNPVSIEQSKGQLLAAYDRLVEHEAARPKAYVPPPPPPWRRYLRPAVLAVAVTAQLYLWIARPAWLYPTYVASLEAPPTAVAERTLVTVAMLVRAYQDDRGSLPASLGDVGVDLPWVRYVAMANGGFHLSTPSGDAEVSSAPATDISLKGRSR